MTIYDRIDHELKKRNLSRRKLAQLSGININTMSSLFARRPEPFPENHLIKIADTLGVPVHELKGLSLVMFSGPEPIKNDRPAIQIIQRHVTPYKAPAESKGAGELLNIFNSLNKEGRRALLAVATTFSIMGEYKDTN